MPITKYFKIIITGLSEINVTTSISKFQFSAKVIDFWGRILVNEKVLWSVSPINSGITVDSTGLVTLIPPISINSITLKAISVSKNSVYTIKNVKLILPIPIPTPPPNPIPVPKVYTNVIGTWANARQIYTTNIIQCSVGDTFLTPNNEKTTISLIEGNYIHTSTDVVSWVGGKVLVYVSSKVYTNVIGTWTNNRELYATNVSQCAVKDIILTPNKEERIIDSISSNWLHVTADMTSWIGGQSIVYIGQGIIVPPIIIIPTTVDLRSPPAGLTPCKCNGTDDTDAILNCINYAKQENLSVTSPEGLYTIRTGVIKPFDGMKWYGKGDNRLVSKATALYNTMLASWNGISNILVEGVGFDQTGDIEMIPNSGNFQGLHMMHIGTCNNIEISACKFFGNGVTLVLSQPPDGYGKGFNFHDNIAYYQKKTNTYYDSTVFNLDGLDGKVYKNKVIVSQNPNVANWWAESGFEVHFRGLDCHDNETINCVNGILPVGNPMQYKTYDLTYQGVINIYNNIINSALRGIPVWGNQPSTISYPTQNINIYDNIIGLYLAKMSNLTPIQYYKPVAGISLRDGFKDANYFRNIKILRNKINFTAETGLNVGALLDYAVPMNQYNEVGMISLYTNNSCEDVEITGNSGNFPYPTFNIRAMQQRGTNKHKRIKVYNNVMNNCDLYHAYDSQGYDAIYNAQYVDDIEFKGNIVNGTPLMTSKIDTNTVSNIRWL
jgi:hypothetical protein